MGELPSVAGFQMMKIKGMGNTDLMDRKALTASVTTRLLV
jgi:hypothetical protein